MQECVCMYVCMDCKFELATYALVAAYQLQQFCVHKYVSIKSTPLIVKYKYIHIYIHN